MTDALGRKYEGTETELRRIFKEEELWKRKPEGTFGSKRERPSRWPVRRKLHLRSSRAWNQRATNPNPSHHGKSLSSFRNAVSLAPTTRYDEPRSRISLQVSNDDFKEDREDAATRRTPGFVIMFAWQLPSRFAQCLSPRQTLAPL